MSNFEFNNVQTYEGAKTLLSNLIWGMIDESKIASGFDDVMSLMPITDVIANSEGETFTTKIPASDFKRVGEGESTPIDIQREGYEKGFKLYKYRKRFAVTDELIAYLSAYTDASYTDSSIKKELRKLGSNAEDLAMGKVKTLNVEATKLLSEGFSVSNPYGYGSASPDGQALFADAHVPKYDTTNTWSNKGTVAFSATNLLAAINSIRDQKTDDGIGVIATGKYILYIPKSKKSSAITEINSMDGVSASMYDNTASNSIKVNIFNVGDFEVEIRELTMLGEKDAEGNSIGNENQWFVINENLVRDTEAIKYIRLPNYGGIIDTFEFDRDANTGTNYVYLGLQFALDHYGAVGFYGSDAS